jgi:hypothetical protein
MFSLPDTDVIPFLNQQIDLDEPAEVIERALNGLYSAHMNDIALRTQTPGLEVLHATVKFHDKFNMDMGRETAERALHLGIKRDPFAALAYASRQDDVDLGRQAIKLIRFGSEEYGDVSLWARMSDIKPSWQLAFAKLTIPTFSYQYHKGPVLERDDEWSSIDVELETYQHVFNMEDVAKLFDPM